MEYFDEEIINARHIKRRDEYGSIEKGMYINNIFTSFHEVLLFENKLSIMLPDGFVPMLPEIADIKYIVGIKPSIIYTSLDTSVNFTFNLYIDTSTEGDIALASGMLKRMLKNINPAYIFYDDMEIESVDGHKISLFNFKSYAIDDAMYNIIYLTQMDKYIVQGGFNCMHYDMQEWKRAAIEVIKTLSLKEE